MFVLPPDVSTSQFDMAEIAYFDSTAHNVGSKLREIAFDVDNGCIVIANTIARDDAFYGSSGPAEIKAAQWYCPTDAHIVYRKIGTKGALKPYYTKIEMSQFPDK